MRWIIALLLALTAGCTLAPKHAGPVDTAILFRLHETLSASGRNLWLSAATEKTYPCINYSIASSVLHAGPGFRVAVDGIVKPDICLTALGPATCQIQLGRLAPGSYPLAIVVEGRTTSSVFAVSAESIAVRIGASAQVRFPEPVLHRVPSGTLWGLVGYTRPSQEPRMLAYFDSLESLGATRQLFTPGNYDVFRVGTDGVIETPAMTGFYFARAYLYRYAGDTVPLGGVVRAFGDSLWVSLYDDRGGTWLSWTR